MAYNQSRIKLFRRCQKAYAFRYDYAEDGGELVPRAPKVALKRGTWLHALQEAHHREWATGGSFIPQVYEELDKQWEGLFDEEREEYGDLPAEVRRIFHTYLFYWKNADPGRYKVATIHNGEPAIEFVLQMPLKGIKDPFKCRIDLMVEDSEYGGLWLWDSKWVGKIPGPDERMMSPQALLYALCARKNKFPVNGFVYNYGRTKPPTLPQILQNGTLTMRQSLDCDYATYLAAIKGHHGSEWKYYAKYVYYDKLIQLRARSPQWFRRERIPVEEDRVNRALDEFCSTVQDIERRNTEVPPRTYDYSCKFGCDYHDPCVAEFTGLDISGLLKTKYVVEKERYGSNSEPDLV